MSHPSNIYYGEWDPVTSLWATGTNPTFNGSSKRKGGLWKEHGVDMLGRTLYDLEGIIRFGSGSTMGSGTWIWSLPLVDGYRLHYDPPEFINAEEPWNSPIIGQITIGLTTGLHVMGSLHPRTTAAGPPATVINKQVVAAVQDGIFLGGSSPAVDNVHIQALCFPGIWVAE